MIEITKKILGTIPPGYRPDRETLVGWVVGGEMILVHVEVDGTICRYEEKKDG